MRHSPLLKFVLLTCLSFVVSGSILLTSAYAQRRSSGPNAPSAVRSPDLKKIDAKASKVENEFLKEAFGLANDYEKAGDLERAIEYLEAMLKINPDLAGAKDKIDELRDEILSANDFDVDYQANPAWGNPVAFVRAGKPFRIRSAGSYRFTLSEQVGAEGFPVGDLQKHMVEDIPAGKLVGLVINPKNKDKKPGDPFEVGNEQQVTPKESGYLFLKVNLPAEARCSGTLQVRLSGYVLSPDGRNVGN